jgi:capsular polysaccharide biosynthesis protein
MTRLLVKLVKYWYLYLIPLLLFPTAATVYGLRKESTYESTASLFVTKQTIIKSLGPQDDNSFATTAQNVSDAMGQLLESSSFLISVAKDTSLNADHSLNDPPATAGQTTDLGPTPAQSAAASRIWGHISVSANQTRNLVFITSDDKDPHVAQELTNGVVTEFNKFYAKTEQKSLQSAQDALTQQLKDITDKVNKDTSDRDAYKAAHPAVNTELGAAADSTYQAILNRLNGDVASQTSTESDLSQVTLQLTQVNTGTPYNVTVQDAPTLPTAQTVKISKVVVYSIGALIAVLALLAIIAAIQTKLDRKIYTRQDIEGILDRLEWDPTAIEVMPIISMNGGRGSIKWEDRENSLVPVLMTPVLASLPRPARKQLRSGTTQAPRRESAGEPSSKVADVDEEE